MKIRIKKNVQVPVTVDVKLPHYFEHDLDLDFCDSIIYGKIEIDRYTTIQITKNYYGNHKKYELSTEKRHPSSAGCYFDCKYSSNENEYLKAKSEMRASLKQC